MAGGKTGGLILAVTTYILRTGSIRMTKNAHLTVPERKSFA